ncbi:MAG: M56 family metallopeptidase [Gemmatimonadaceae bacterium]
MNHPPAAHVARSLAHREQAHRRAVLLGVATLLILSTSPVFGHHLTGSANALLAGRDHLWSICLIAVHLLLAPVHGFFHLLLFAGLAFACADRFRATRNLRRTLRMMEWTSVGEGDQYAIAAHEAGLAPGDLRVVSGLPVPAFTTGWIRPRVFIAANLTSRLAPSEVAAVLAHEAAHVARRDPARLSVLRFFACVLFWLPALRRLAADLADEAEIEADDRAAQRYPLALASALVCLAGGAEAACSALTLQGGAGFAGSGELALLERRVRRLTGDDSAPSTHVTRRSLLGAGGRLPSCGFPAS